MDSGDGVRRFDGAAVHRDALGIGASCLCIVGILPEADALALLKTAGKGQRAVLGHIHDPEGGGAVVHGIEPATRKV